MTAKTTVVLFVHGANQAKKNEAKNKKTWEEAFDVTDHARKVQNLVVGSSNAEIAAYHEKRHPVQDYPQYSDWAAPWYGNVWASISASSDPFNDRLNESDEANDDRISIIEKIEQKGITNHFDELAPFYELVVVKSSGNTLYEMICREFLDQLIEATNSKQHYVLVGHSMGCAVTYNVMSHISCAQTGEDYCPLDGSLSKEYRQIVSGFANSPAKCFGLLTFGNYTGYDWCQRLNNKVLFGQYKEQFKYPKAVGRWFNFWTLAGGDPYILDDQLGDDMVGDDEGHYEDVAVRRIPGTHIGHGRAKWFRRNQFAKGLREKMAEHLYL